MVPLHDFVTATETTLRRKSQIRIAFFVGFFSALVCSIILLAVSFQPTAMWVIRVSTPLFLVWLFGGLLWTRVVDETPRCPHCGSNNCENAAWTVATRNCCGCGRRMLAEPDVADQECESRLSLDEFLAWVVRGGWSIKKLLVGTLRNDGRKALSRPQESLARVGHCPFCAGSLHTVRHSCVIVLATGNCGHCGRRILDQMPNPVGDSSISDPDLLSIEDFRAACRSKSRTNLLLVATAVATVTAGIIVGYFLITGLTGSNETIDPQWYHFAVFFGPMIVMAVFTIFFGRELERRDSRWYCPRCNVDLMRDAGAAVIAARRCVQCGQRVAAEPI